MLILAHAGRWGRVVSKDKLLKEGIPKYFKPHPPIQPINQNMEENRPTEKHTSQHSCPSQDRIKSQAQGAAKSQDTNKSQDTAKKPLSSINGVDNLTHKAADLSISTKPLKALPHRVGREVEVRRSPRIQAKRVRSVVDEVSEPLHACSC